MLQNSQGSLKNHQPTKQQETHDNQMQLIDALWIKTLSFGL